VVDPANRGRDTRSLGVAEVLGPGGIADIMDGLRAQGLCDWIGLTALGDPGALAEVVDSGRFDAAQVYYNLLNPTAMSPAGPGWSSTDFDGLLNRCAAQDMGVMGIRIFAGGHLASSERHGREIAITANAENAAEEARARAAWGVLGSTYGTGAQTALRFGLACPLLSTIVVGIGEMWHLDEALTAAERGPLPDAALAELEALWRSHPAFRS
jgi:L-glyceraldehyde 3-phosphate reductase